MNQQRLLVGAPKDVTEEDLANILRKFMEKEGEEMAGDLLEAINNGVR